MRIIILIALLIVLVSATPLSNDEVKAIVRKENDGSDKDGSDHDHSGHDHSDHDHDSDKDKNKGTTTGGSSGNTASGASTSGGDLSGVPVAAGAQGAKTNPCFPGTAMVTLEGGLQKQMIDLSIGDRVAVGSGKYSEVFMFTHRLKNEVHQFVEVSTQDGAKVRATEGHFLYVNGKYIGAGEVRVGDVVERENGRRVTVSRVERVMDVGLFNPQTAHGDIVVNGIRASTYTMAVERGFAHAALAPVRAAFARFGFVCGLFESGGGQLTNIVPGY